MRPSANADKSTAESLSAVEAIHKKLVTSSNFEYSFVDEEYGNKFKAEKRIGNLASVFAALGHIDLVPRLVWIVGVHRGTTDERDRCEKSDRRVAAKYLDVVIEGVCRSGIDLTAEGDAGNLLLPESMAVDIPLSHRTPWVDIYGGRCSGLIDHVTDRKLSRNKGSQGKPGEELAK